MRLSDADHARVAAAIADAESRTSGEIYCMVADDGHRYTGFALALAAFLAFLLPFVAMLGGFGPAQWGAWAASAGWLSETDMADRRLIELFVAAQAAVFAVATAVLLLTPLSQRLAPSGLRQERVHELALRQFLAKGLHMTAGRTGVLILLSTRDRVAEVVADRAIYERVPADHWGDAVAALLAGAKRGDVAAGFVAAISLAGAVLAEHFPPAADNPNELEDRLVVI